MQLEGDVEHAPPMRARSIPDGYRCLSGFLASDRADALLRWALDSVPWRVEYLCLFGRRHRVPRRVAWFGEPGLNYRYSGRDHEAAGWPREVIGLKQAVEEAAGTRFNFVLLNRYADGSDHMGWHRDDEAGMEALVASVSLGAGRRFLIRRPSMQTSDRLDLGHGSLLLFDGSLLHRLPPARRVREARVNLTFRSLR